MKTVDELRAEINATVRKFVPNHEAEKLGRLIGELVRAAQDAAGATPVPNEEG